MGGQSMKQDEVLEFLKLCDDNDIQVWIDGGWAVDALLGRQTREHEDLDIALRHTDAEKLREILERQGYKNVPRDDTRDCNFVLGDQRGRLIDFHTFELDKRGNNTFGVAYESKHLTGSGIIGNKKVRTIEPTWLVKFHTGYAVDENDYHDVKLLCEKFNLIIPDDYTRFTKN